MGSITDESREQRAERTEAGAGDGAVFAVLNALMRDGLVAVVPRPLPGTGPDGPRWVVVVDDGRWLAECLRCGTMLAKPPLPIDIRAYIALMGRYQVEHARCEPLPQAALPLGLAEDAR